MTKVKNEIHKYKRYELIFEGTLNNAIDYYEKEVGWDFNLMFPSIQQLNIGERINDITGNII